MAMVMFAPGGVAIMLVLYPQALRPGYARRRALPYAAATVTGAIALAGFLALLEMLHHCPLEALNDTVLVLFGLDANASTEVLALAEQLRAVRPVRSFHGIQYARQLPAAAHRS
jgi:fermentation-respiration switch protein FrsA (DUF1100 family)